MPDKIARIGNVNLYYTESDYLTERRLELSMGHDFLNRFPKDSITELGAVMFYQGRQDHEIIDLYDTSDARIKNLDGAEFDYTGRNVLSISTIEHFDDIWVEHPIGHYKGGIKMTDKSFQTIEKIISTAKNYFITVPIAIQTRMDASILASDIRRLVVHRDAENNWTKHDNVKDIASFTYDKRFICAEAIHVITNLENYFED